MGQVLSNFIDFSHLQNQLLRGYFDDETQFKLYDIIKTGREGSLKVTG